MSFLLPHLPPIHPSLVLLAILINLFTPLLPLFPSLLIVFLPLLLLFHPTPTPELSFASLHSPNATSFSVNLTRYT